MRFLAATVAAATLAAAPTADASGWTSVRTTSVSAWMPTYRCENGGYGWHANTGNGFYGGLQFTYGTWVAHGGRQFASRADYASPAQQVLVASRLRYDGWPNCPNPPRYR